MAAAALTPAAAAAGAAMPTPPNGHPKRLSCDSRHSGARRGGSVCAPAGAMGCGLFKLSQLWAPGAGLNARRCALASSQLRWPTTAAAPARRRFDSTRLDSATLGRRVWVAVRARRLERRKADTCGPHVSESGRLWFSAKAGAAPVAAVGGGGGERQRDVARRRRESPRCAHHFLRVQIVFVRGRAALAGVGASRAHAFRLAWLTQGERAHLAAAAAETAALTNWALRATNTRTQKLAQAGGRAR